MVCIEGEKIMKLAGIVRILLLISTLGASALIYAQDQREEPKPKEDDARPETVKPHDEANPARHQEDAKAPKQQQEEAKPTKQQEEAKPAQGERRPSEQENGKASKQNDHEQMSPQRAQSGAQHGGRIPDDKFRSNFGRQHTVVINRPTIVEGQPRFQYGGYWFNIVDAWPGDWAYTDQCYIDYIDGEYFLFDLAHPGVRIALFVVL
jgi:hypothetical protein